MKNSIKTEAQLKFETIVREGIHHFLKPKGFKKRGLNFKRTVGELSHVLNIQRSQYNSQSDIKFTINLGIFSPDYYKIEYDYNFEKENKIPDFPREYDSIIRLRIGALRYEEDKWYKVNSNTDIRQIIKEMDEDINKFILPFFDKISTIESLLNELKLGKITGHPPQILKRFLLLVELGKFDEAKEELKKLSIESRTEWAEKKIHKCIEKMEN